MVYDLFKNAFQDENQDPNEPIPIVSSPKKWVRRPEPVYPPHSMIIEEIVEDSEDVEESSEDVQENSDDSSKENSKSPTPKSFFKPEKKIQRGRISKVKERKPIEIKLEDVMIGTKRYFSKTNPIHFCVKCCMGFVKLNELTDHFEKEHDLE
uniref:C2H2-type domain-containing protein n=1 Tax=Caenorhabditis tropicalis TaxID=1561998 RepID=A0A1I7UTI6_9PELO